MRPTTDLVFPPGMARAAQDVRQEVDRLRRELEHHDHRYHVLDDPEISDAEYDALFRKLEALESAHPELVTPDSPTQRVGATPISGFATVTHHQQMLSLQNATTPEELREFDARIRKFLGRDRITYAGEPKMDGVAVELVYEDGALTVGSTRGDGIMGENVTREHPNHPQRAAAAARPRDGTSRRGSRSAARCTCRSPRSARSIASARRPGNPCSRIRAMRPPGR